MDRKDLAMFKAQVYAEIKKMEAESTAKEVAGKAIGKDGLGYITLIIIIGVGASLFLDNDKIAAVMGLLGSALTALISMLNGIAGAQQKQEKPEFEIMRHLIDKLDQREEAPMEVAVEGGAVIVKRGKDVITTRR